MLASVLSLILLSASPTPASNLLGDWSTPDLSVVRVVPCGPKLCMRLVFISAEEPGTRDVNNPNPAERGRPLCGVVIGEGFEPDGPDHAKDGHLYDPKDGKTYSGEMTAEGARLKLRGYIGISLFGRTETWKRTQQAIPPCK